MRYLASHFRWTAGIFVGVLALLPARAELGVPNRVLITDDGRGPIWWSPDGTKIAFQSDRDGDGLSEFYVADADGTNVRENIPGETLRWMLNFSPDGTQILLYDVGDSDNDNDFDIYVQDVDEPASVRKNLTQNPAFDFAAIWSPDGTKIAFESTRDGNVDIYVMDSDGTNLQNLTQNPTSDVAATWSPDGTKIAFQSDRDRVGGRWDIWIVDSDGTNPQNLTQNPVIDDMYPTWSPDGTRIAFQSSREGLSIRDSDIWIMDADGTNPQNLTQTSGIGDTRPVWSPDGTRIAFQSDDDAIWVLELEAVSTGVAPATWGTVKRTVFE
ncbi:MAG: hypothetical protein OXI72_15575 [Gemmatimonadota bacterium]|nr:hypothetical protein [Gemmatimonadota bacterium]